MITPALSADKPSPWDFYQNVLMPATLLFRDMHHTGFVIDHEGLDSLDVELSGSLDKLEQEMFDEVGQEFNPRSSQQVGGILFDKLGLPLIKKRSTDVEVLTALYEKTGNTFPNQMLQHRGLTKIHGTYIKGIGKHLASDGRLHPEFMVHGAVSRTSSREPNVQNIPRDSDADAPGAVVKKVFIAPKGWKFAHLDFSQHEFRQVAIYSEDEWLREVYRNDGDMHSEVAIDLYGSDYSYEERVKAKTYNFGLLYQRGAFSLSLQTGESVRESEERIEAFFDRMPDVRRWIEACKRTVLDGQDLVSLLGRHRRFDLITRANVDDIIKQAVNFLPQSSGSDSALMGIHEAWSTISSEVYKPVGFHHDAQTCYIKEDVWEEVLVEVARAMERGASQAIKGDVPFKVETEIGNSWGTVKKVEIEHDV